MIFKSRQYKVSKEKMNIPIQLITNKYDNVYKKFLNKINEKSINFKEDDLIYLGVLVRYNSTAGILMGISLCFYFENKTKSDKLKIEFEVFDGFNITELDLIKYKLFFEKKLQQSNIDFNYSIQHKDERNKDL